MEFSIVDKMKKIIKKIFRLLGTSRGFWMELDTKKRFCHMINAFVGVVVGVILQNQEQEQHWLSSGTE
jgi:hypothetical protein